MNISYINNYVDVKNDISEQRMYPYRKQGYVIGEMSKVNFLLFILDNLCFINIFISI